MRTLRNVFRRKGRAFLTIFGITIGVFALVVMGSMAEKITLLVDGGMRYYGDKVQVNARAASALAAQPISTRKVRELENMTGVARASAQVGMLLDDELGAVNMGTPPMIVASDLRSRDWETFKMTLAQGRDLQPGDDRKAVVGCDLVKKLNAQLGAKIRIKKEDYEVVGIWDKTLTAPDNEVTIPMEDAQRLYRKSLPEAVRASIDEKTLASVIVVYPRKGVNPENLAKLITHSVGADYQATGPSAFRDQIAAATSTLTSIIFGIALVSLMVGGLSVINTMTMAVAERTREIGIRKAIGASNFAVMRQFVAEAAVIGLIGGLTGLALGGALVWLVNAATESGGSVIFLLTDRLAIGSVVFAVVLGVVSGLYPAWHAAGLNPVEALRYE